MTDLVAIGLPDRCANLLCTNRPGEGQFVLLNTSDLFDTSPGASCEKWKVPVQLYMCYPCANTLNKHDGRTP